MNALKDWARFKTDTAPAWVLAFMYAETFGAHPQDVPQTVYVKWWERWKTLSKARNSKALWERWRSPGKKQPMSGDDLTLFNWAILKDQR